MNFLHPEFLSWLPLAIIPLLIYLFFRKKLQKIEFSSLFLLKDLATKQKRKIKFENILLLIVRTLLILLLILFFSGSYFGQKIKHFSEKSTRLFVFLDNSPSMQDNGSGFTNQQSATTALLTLCSNFPQSEIKIITAMHNEEYFVNNSDDLKTLDKVKETPSSISLQQIFRRADDFFYYDSNSNKFNNHLFIFSDGKILADSTITARSYKDQNINRFSVLDFKSKSEETDFSIDSLLFNNQDNYLNLICYISADHHDLDNSLLVEIFGESSKLAEKKIILEKNRAVINFPLQPSDLGQKAYLKIPDDKNNSNNFYYFKLPGRKQQKILVAGDSLAYSYKQIKKLLGLNDLESFFQTKYTTINNLAQMNLNDYAAIILPALPDLNSYTVSQLDDYLTTGKGLYIIAGSFDPASYNSQVQAKLALPVVQGISSAGNGFFQLSNINTDHQLLKNVFTNDFKIGSLEVYKSYNCRANEVILRTENFPLLTINHKGSGKTLFLATSLEKSWSNLGENGLLVPLIFNGLKYLTSTTAKLQLAYQPKDKIDFLEPSQSLTTPNGNEIIVYPDGKMPNLLQTGFYKFAKSSGQEDFFAYNSLRENQQTISPELLDKKHFTSLNSKDLSDTNKIFGNDSRFSFWLLLSIFLCLAAELILTRRGSK